MTIALRSERAATDSSPRYAARSTCDRSLEVCMMLSGMHQSSGVAVAATATNVRLLPLDGDDATVAQRIPLGRLGLPRKLGSAALFLASDASSFVTGIDLRIDGGVSLL